MFLNAPQNEQRRNGNVCVTLTVCKDGWSPGGVTHLLAETGSEAKKSGSSSAPTLMFQFEKKEKDSTI